VECCVGFGSTRGVGAHRGVAGHRSNLYGYGPVDAPITACESHVCCSKNSLASITSSVTHAYTSPNATAFS
jgi:hypothetical protein